ncbi:MAG: carbon-nitrogen hydrolase family protein [Oscillospiraceae bacterium]|nr:carbon-nitrogen hydrolase family protein [Oscillospiraceae bacterium]
MGKAKIGLIQVDLRSGGTMREKWDKLIELAKHCLDHGADLVFFPECYQHTQDYGIINCKDEFCEKYNEWKYICSQLAKEYNAYIVPWDYKIEDDKIYNTSYILDRNGIEVGEFKKVHLPYGEVMMGISSGDDFPAFNLDIGKVGIMICFDNYYPESARILGLRGAELVLYPLYGDTLFPQWELKMRARAVDNTMYVASCQIGSMLDIAYTGIVNPNGDVITRLDAFNTWQVVEIEMGKEIVTHTTGDRNYSENIRKYLEKCREPSVYKALLQETRDLSSWDEIFYGKRPK